MQQEGPSITISGLSECHYNGKCVKLIGLKLILLYYLTHITSVLALSHFWWLVPVTCSSPRRAVRSHSLVCSKNSLLIVGIGPILNKSLNLFFDLIALIVRVFIVRYQDCMINYIYNTKKVYYFLDIKM